MKSKEYSRCKKIRIYGNDQKIVTAERALDGIKEIDFGITKGNRLKAEVNIRLKIQELMDQGLIKADILVDGNTVYPYSKTIKEYDRLKKIGRLDTMTNSFYLFLSLNFDIAHYNKQGFIGYYNGDFFRMKREILDHASVPVWYADLRKILDYIQEDEKSKAAA